LEVSMNIMKAEMDALTDAH
jgi:hypothetical protein